MTTQQEKTCPICKFEGQYARVKDYGERLTYECVRCGTYTITRSAERKAAGSQNDPKLSAWIRDQNEKGADIPEIHTGNLNEIVSALPDYSPRDKQLILLRNIQRQSKYPGFTVNVIPDMDTPLAWATDEKEIIYYLQSLVDRGFLVIANPADRERPVNDYISSFVITANGWDYLEQKATQVEDRTQVFVAMSFSPAMKSVWEKAIKPAIAEAGYKAYRVDVTPHIDRIDARIIAEIKNSRFIVADVTEQKQGVYFEAGYALGLGLPVIWCVRKDELKAVHFDTRQYRHIVWDSEGQLKKDLYDLIRAIL